MLTRADVELAVTRRCGSLAAEAGLDGATADGTNADCNDPIADALEALNRPVAARSLVADADLAAVPDADARQLVALAEIRYLESALANLTTYDASYVNASEKPGQLGDRLLSAIRHRAETYARRWGDAGGPALAGPIGGPTNPPPVQGVPPVVGDAGLTDLRRFIP